MSRVYGWVVIPSLLAAACGGPGGTAASGTPAPDTPAGALVARSIEFHDPDGIWGHREIRLDWAGTDAKGGERVAVQVRLGEDPSDFSLSGRYAGSEIEYRTTGQDWSVVVDGSEDPSPEVRERMRLNREDGMFWRSYYGFLVGLPMKILDPGTHLDPDVIETTFHDRPVQAVRLTYDPEVGGETWYFYFDPDTAELVGCRFYYDESLNDGEYIVFENLVEAGTLRLPRNRRWYVNVNSRFLGEDEIGSLEVGS